MHPMKEIPKSTDVLMLPTLLNISGYMSVDVRMTETLILVLAILNTCTRYLSVLVLNFIYTRYSSNTINNTDIISILDYWFYH